MAVDLSETTLLTLGNGPDAVTLIPLTRGKAALVDPEDAPKLLVHSWIALRTEWGWYARRNEQRDGRKIYFLMHRVILDAPPGTQVDHRNRDGLDNRRVNLRLASPSDNQANQILRSDNTSGYKGVTWHKQTQRWNAQIRVDGSRLHLGLSDTTVEAALAYDKAAQFYFGMFARLNFPGPGELEIQEEDEERSCRGS